MAWRKWLVRALVFSVTSGLAAGGLLYRHWTNPTAVRRQVIDKMSALLVGADVHLESAHMRLLGGISLRDLRLTRRDDPDKTDLVYVPVATIYLDKEQFRNGKLAIRKVELDRPHFRIRRNREGQWNLTGIFAPVHLEEPVPTLEIRQGTIIVEDHFACPGQPAVELSDVHLVLINDPPAVVRFKGTGTSDLAGAIHIEGTFQRTTHDTSVAVQATGIRIGKPLVQRGRVYCADLGDYANDLEGTANLQAEFGYTAGAARPWTHNVRCQLSDGKFSHPKLPLALTEVEATASCIDGQITLQDLKARSGQAEVTSNGRAACLDWDTNFAAELKIEHLPVTSAVFDNLPPSLQKINQDFHPAGPVCLILSCERTDGQWKRTCLIQPEDLKAVYQKFPYPLEHISGIIRQEIDTARHLEQLHIDLVGLAESQKVFIKGDLKGEAPNAAVALRIWGAKVPLDEKLRQALSHTYQRVAASFNPTGLADFEVHVHRPAGSPEFANHFLIRFHHATLRYEIFPYPLEDVSGTLDIQPNHWEFYDFRGIHKGGTFQAAGQFRPGTRGDLLTVHIRGEDVMLDPELEQALVDPPELKQAWKAFTPAGRMKFTAQVVRRGNQTPDVTVGVTATACTVKPEFFPYTLEDLTGALHYGQRWITLTNLQARHGATRLSLEQGKIYVRPEGGVWAEIENIQATRLIADGDLLRALPPALKSACETVQLKDPLHLKTDLTLATFPAGTGSSPRIYWKGEVACDNAALRLGVQVEHVTGKAACEGLYDGQQVELVGNFHLDKATLFRQPFRDILGAIEVRKESPNTLAIHHLRARIFGGEVYGPVRVDFGPKTDFELALTASHIKLEDFGRHNLKQHGQISGLANASLFLKGRGSDISTLVGSGSIDVPSGRLYNNLPLLLDLLKFLAIRLPDGTAFEEAHANFSLKGDHVSINRLDLFGNSISLRGQGGMNLNGNNIENIDLDFYAVWARVTQFLPPIIKELPQEVSKHLLKIKMQGRITNGVSDVHFKQEPVPVLVEPLKGLLERMARGTRASPTKETTDRKWWDK
jgi:hypothetical protein